MKKMFLAANAAVGPSCGQAFAIPITWEVEGSNFLGDPSGSLTYDASNNVYSGIGLFGELGAPSPTSVSGSATQLTAASDILSTLSLWRR